MRMQPNRHLTTAALALLLLSGAAAGAEEKEPQPHITIDLEPTRETLEAGGHLGVVGKITNVSEEPVYLREHDLSITLPVELEGRLGDSYGYPAFFPTEPDPSADKEDHRGSDKLILQPGDSYGVIWTPTRVGEGGKSWRDLAARLQKRLQFLFFAPGDYVLTFSGKYWVEKGFPPDCYRTLTKSSSITVQAPELIIILGSMLGGLIGFVVFYGFQNGNGSPVPAPVAGLRSLWQPAKHFFSNVVGAVGAMLLAAIVSILLSRLATSQFIIQVTIRDFWGAIAIGFVANYAGRAILNRILPSGDPAPDDALGDDGAAAARPSPAGASA